MKNFFIGFSLYILTLLVIWAFVRVCLKKGRSRSTALVKKGELLFKEVIQISRLGLAAQESIILTEYKFYTRTFYSLLELYRNLGVDIFHVLTNLRKKLQKDIEFEKKVKSLLIGSLGEVSLVTCLSWFFIAFSFFHLEIRFAPVDLLIIFLWEALGLITLVTGLTKLKKHYFDDFFCVTEAIILFSSLVFSPLSFKEILERIKFQEILELRIKDNALKDLIGHLSQTLTFLKTHGTIEEVIIEELTQRLEYEFNRRLDQLHKKVKTLKFFVLVTFFVLSYFYALFCLMLSMQL